MRPDHRPSLKQRAARTPAAVLLVPLGLACTPFVIAMDRPSHDLSVLKEGTSREELIEELGPPVFTHEPSPDDEDSRCYDDMLFGQGFTPTEKAIMVPLALTLDFFTLGLAEVALFPAVADRSIDPPDVGILVRYDAERRLESACVYQGWKVIASHENAPPECSEEEMQLHLCIRAEESAPQPP